jgi:hypothetical protein
MPPLRKRQPEAAEMIEVNMRATPSPDTIEMPTVTHSVYGQYRPSARSSHNFSRPYTGDYTNLSNSTLALESPQTPQNMSSAHLPPFAPSLGPPSYQPSPAPTRSSSPYPGAHSPFVGFLLATSIPLLTFCTAQSRYSTPTISRQLLPDFLQTRLG